MKLELKHLAPYQLHSLKVMDLYDDKESILCGISKTESNLKVEIYRKETIVMSRFLSEVKPILNPLTYLTDINSEFYRDSNMDLVDQVELNSLIDEILYDKQSSKTIEDIPYKYMKILFKYHIDVFGLILEGLAIDINTL